jgi:hypothetical protein
MCAQRSSPWQPVALQTFRVGVELAFWRLHTEGLAPIQITFDGRNFDALVGLTVPCVAASHWPEPPDSGPGHSVMKSDKL